MSTSLSCEIIRLCYEQQQGHFLTIIKHPYLLINCISVADTYMINDDYFCLIIIYVNI